MVKLRYFTDWDQHHVHVQLSSTPNSKLLEMNKGVILGTRHIQNIDSIHA